MNMPREQGYGSWVSPVTAAAIAQGSRSLGTIGLDGNDIYWTESDPEQGGGFTVLRHVPSKPPDRVLPAGFDVRTRVHEYGGAAFTVANGTLYFSNDADGQLYRCAPGGEPDPIATSPGDRFADLVYDQRWNRLIGVRESTVEGRSEPVDSIAAISLDEAGHEQITTLVKGHDFYANPRLSGDGSKLAWLAWNHPNMPWDASEVWVGDLDDAGQVTVSRLVAGGQDESVFQPEWSPRGKLTLVSDRTGWWNLYRLDTDVAVPVREEEAEYGLPLWSLGMSTYGFVEDTTILAASSRDGSWSLATIDIETGASTPIELPSTALSQIVTGPGVAVLAAASPVEATAIVRLDLVSRELEIVRRLSELEIDRPYLSVPGSLTYPTSNGDRAHAFFYPPQNADYDGLQGELPPLIVMSHGGPTGSTSTGLEFRIQFWTSRGIAVLDVNYRGSTGYGRAYRDALKGNWGVYDVDDCVHGARHLIEEGLVDPSRIAIRGSSASGFTTLAALTFHDTFCAGVSLYGIADLEALAMDTHKFESRYLDSMVGPYPECRETYIERSPIHHVDRLSAPLLLLQGSDDPVVPPNQARMMYDAVVARGLPAALIIFDCERHGFRKTETIQRAFEAELSFLGQLFGFEPADALTPITLTSSG
jgi:dipeptidyl aminopeptidase/acylaminoacyl peptidase